MLMLYVITYSDGKSWPWDCWPYSHYCSYTDMTNCGHYRNRIFETSIYAVISLRFRHSLVLFNF